MNWTIEKTRWSNKKSFDTKEQLYIYNSGVIHPLIGAKLDERYDYMSYKDEHGKWRYNKTLKNKSQDCCDECKKGNIEECNDTGGFQFDTIFEDNTGIHLDFIEPEQYDEDYETNDYNEIWEEID